MLPCSAVAAAGRMFTVVRADTRQGKRARFACSQQARTLRRTNARCASDRCSGRRQSWSAVRRERDRGVSSCCSGAERSRNGMRMPYNSERCYRDAGPVDMAHCAWRASASCLTADASLTGAAPVAASDCPPFAPLPLLVCVALLSPSPVFIDSLRSFRLARRSGRPLRVSHSRSVCLPGAPLAPPD